MSYFIFQLHCTQFMNIGLHYKKAIFKRYSKKILSIHNWIKLKRYLSFAIVQLNVDKDIKCYMQDHVWLIIHIPNKWKDRDTKIFKVFLFNFKNSLGTCKKQCCSDLCSSMLFQNFNTLDVCVVLCSLEKNTFLDLLYINFFFIFLLNIYKFANNPWFFRRQRIDMKVATKLKFWRIIVLIRY